MAELNFGLLTPPGSQSIGNAFVTGMDQAQEARARDLQMQQSVRKGQMDELQFRKAQDTEAKLNRWYAGIAKNGGPTDRIEIENQMLGSDIQQIVDMGLKARMIRLGQEEDRKRDLEAMFGPQPPAANSTPTAQPPVAGSTAPAQPPVASETPPPTNSLAFAAAPAVNNLDPEKSARLKMLSKNPGVVAAGRIELERILNPTITSGAPGSTILRNGVLFGTVPTAFETMLANSDLTREAKVLARKALIGKETNIAQPEFIDNLRALAEATDPATRTFLTNRLNYLTTHAPGTNLSVNTVVPASVAAQTEFMKEIRATYGTLKQSSAMFENIEAAKKLIPSASAFMGAGGEGLKTAASFLNNRFGMNINTEGVKDATELQSRLFQGIMDNLKKLDSQPSQQQQAAMKEALGSISTDPRALPNVLDALGDSVRSKIDIHNAEVQSAISRGVKFPYDPIIKVPAKTAGPDVYVRGSDGVIRKQVIGQQ